MDRVEAEARAKAREEAPAPAPAPAPEPIVLTPEEQREFDALQQKVNREVDRETLFINKIKEILLRKDPVDRGKWVIGLKRKLPSWFGLSQDSANRIVDMAAFEAQGALSTRTGTKRNLSASPQEILGIQRRLTAAKEALQKKEKTVDQEVAKQDPGNLLAPQAREAILRPFRVKVANLQAELDAARKGGRIPRKRTLKKRRGGK